MRQTRREEFFCILLMKNNESWEVPREDVKLQPLREPNTKEKAKYWADEDVEMAIKEANIKGIDLQKLFDAVRAGNCV